jgi:hypothetical protein
MMMEIVLISKIYVYVEALRYAALQQYRYLIGAFIPVW